MFETIAMFGGIIGGVVALLAIVVFFLLKKNVLDILNKDAVLFDKNFEIKQAAINESMAMVDELAEKGKVLTLNPAFNAKAKACYNNLLCVVSDLRLADEFYALAIDKDIEIDATRLAEYKLRCRKDIGLKIGKTQLVDRTLKPKEVGANEAILRANAASGNSYSDSFTPTEPIPQPVQNPVQPNQPMQPNSQPRPNLMQRATTTNGQPNSMPPKPRQ